MSGEKGKVRALLIVRSGQPAQRLGGDERDIAVEHQDLLGVAGGLLRLRDGMAGAQRLRLHHVHDVVAQGRANRAGV